MSVPTTREQFKINILRRNGHPVLEVNVDDDQLEDRIDEALDYWSMFAYDSTEHVYYTYMLTQTDITNRYITIPTTIQGVSRILLPNTGILNGGDLFNVRYQIALNDIYSISSVSMVPYFMVMEQLSLISEILIGKQPIRYNRHSGILYVDTDWNFLGSGQYIIVEAFQNLDPTANPAIWSDRWLQKFAAALVKEQWGINLTKFTGMQLPGGVQFNGQQILADAKAEIALLKQEMEDTYSEPPQMITG